MQGMTRNPLADPGLLGLTSGANAALAVTIAFIPSVNYLGITIACFIGAAVGAILVFGIAAIKRGGFSPLRIVLAGAAVSAFLYAIGEGVGIYFKISKDVSMWTAGGMVGTSWEQLQIIVPFIVGGIFIALLLSRQLTILSLNEEVAVGLGQQTTKVKNHFICCDDSSCRCFCCASRKHGVYRLDDSSYCTRNCRNRLSLYYPYVRCHWRSVYAAR